MRTLGATNKPKTIPVKLSDVNKILAADAIVWIDAKYGFMFNQAASPPLEIEEQKKEEEMGVSFRIIDLNKDGLT